MVTIESRNLTKKMVHLQQQWDRPQKVNGFHQLEFASPEDMVTYWETGAIYITDTGRYKWVVKVDGNF